MQYSCIGCDSLFVFAFLPEKKQFCKERNTFRRKVIKYDDNEWNLL